MDRLFVLADPVRNRFYVLRQDQDQVLVFDGSTYTQIATLKTSATPTQMTMTFDRQYLIIGHDNSQFAYVYNLDTFQQQVPIQSLFRYKSVNRLWMTVTGVQTSTLMR